MWIPYYVSKNSKRKFLNKAKIVVKQKKVMDKDVQSFILAMKRNSNNKDFRQIVTDYMSEYSGCPKSAYNDTEIFRITKTYFLEYLKTAEKPWADMFTFFDVKSRNPDDTYAMLVVMRLAQVKDDDGNFVNGFSKI